MLLVPAATVGALFTAPSVAHAQIAAAQIAAAHVAEGDREADALRPLPALSHYEAAIAADSVAGAAYWKAANMLLDAADFESDRGLQAEQLARASILARVGAALLPGDADALFVRGRAVGRTALEGGTRERLRAAGEVRRYAEAALRLEPEHGGALHLLGRWHAEIMRIGVAGRVLARTLLGGGDDIRGASWEEAIRLLESAVAVQPEMLTHRTALAEIYLERGRRADARAQLEAVERLPATAFNDAHHKRRASEMLRRLR